MRLLGIHYFAPPTAVVASRRLASIYAVLEGKGVQTDIITSENHALRKQEDAYRIQANIHTVAGKGLRERLAGSDNVQLSGNHKKSRLFTGLNQLRQSYPLLYLTDEGGPVYFKNALQSARQLVVSRQVTHLFTSYRPWVDHRIGAALKKEFPTLHWIADFRDLPVDIVRQDVVLPKYQSWIGQQIIGLADEVWVVSEGQKAQLSKWHKNINVIYNGLEQLPEKSEPAASDQFIINYTGSLYPGLQSVDLLQSAFSAYTDIATSLVKNIQLQYVGKDQAVWKKWLAKFPAQIQYSSQAVQPQQVVRQLQKTAATNLLLNWSAKDYYGILTAKLYDYLAAGRPITALVNGPDDPELRHIIEGSGAGKVFHNGQSAALATWLESLHTTWKKQGGTLAWESDPSKLAHLSMQEQLKHLPSLR